MIGPAVNHASRLQALAAELGHTVVTSQSFATAAEAQLQPLGAHPLKGVSEPQEVYALAD